ncbi:FAD-binding oxidoreductase [Olivibacter sp. XZL3]|uniref:FAD-binding oxidoreductase n=1 Tax=Olivibacter sp. XZL3 TaxID=1735116 RepID=UPI001066CA2E|nr:FAD-binding oxidoreductase [Olivibacter sp. XZL3]
MPSAPKWVFDVFDRLLSSKSSSMVVSKVEYLSNTVKRIQFKGNIKKLNFGVGSFIDFRVSDTEARRYTVSYVNAAGGILELIAHLHGEAPGSSFMGNLSVGDKVNINPPRPYKYYDPSAERYIIFGDETSLGLACSFLPVLLKNRHPFHFYLELAEENKNIASLLQLENCTVFTKNGSFGNEKWLNDLPIVQSPEWQQSNFILTGNAKSVRAFRKVLKARNQGKIISHGYWLEGKKGL